MQAGVPCPHYKKRSKPAVEAVATADCSGTVTIEHYTRRNEHLNPLAVELLDSAFSPDSDDRERPDPITQS